MTARINKIALAGWRGITYLELQLDQGPLTALVGVPGAGKSTVAMILCSALLPDRRVLEVTPLSGVQDSHRVGVDEIAARVDPQVGFAYMALEIRAANGTRLVAGLHVRLVEARARFTCLHWRELPDDWKLQDSLRVIDGEDELYPDLGELAAGLAQRGVSLDELKSVREYGELLWEAGVLPSDYADTADRTLYAKLIESTFRGGLSREVTTRIKDYMLPAATRLPESVDRLQRCADAVMRSKSALSTAERQLTLLRATYGQGRALVTRAVASLLSRSTAAAQERDRTETAVANHHQAASSAQTAKSEYEELIATTAREKTRIEENFAADLEQHGNDLSAAKGDKILKAGAVSEARTQLQKFSTGRTSWKFVLGDLEARSWDGAREALGAAQDANARDAARLELELERLNADIERLRAGVAESASAQLADALDATSLAQAFESVDEKEALALELELCGLAEGVIGADLSQLAAMKHSVDFPTTFWLRTKAPEPAHVHEVGDWHAVATAGGYVVSSKRRQLSFGRQAREKHLARLDAAAREIREKSLVILATTKEQLVTRQERLIEHKEAIALFLADPQAEPTFRTALEQAQKAAALADEKANELQGRVNSLNRERTDALAEADKRLQKHREGLADAVQRAQRAKDAIEEETQASFRAKQELATLEVALRSAQEKLGASWEWMLQEAKSTAPGSREQFIAAQANGLAKLGESLADESAERTAWLQTVDPLDEAAVCGIWKPLRDIVADHISVAGLESSDGVDLIDQMSRTRQELSAKLDADRILMRTEATSLYASIATEIRRQTRRVEQLSAFGEGLAFGNVTGMRIRAHPREDLLEQLRVLAKQVDLFERGSETALDVQLAELFNKKMNTQFSGSQLLDYRTYMDLTIEARRRGEWDLASGLSGGESIGGGLAFSLMLARSLAARSGRRADSEFTPMFVIDEVQRLDSEGQALIVEFGRAQKIQVLVTALAIEHKFPCTLYVMARQSTPVEQVVARRVLVKPRPESRTINA